MLWYTALSTAAFYGHLEIVQLLLYFKADVHNKSDEGITPLHWAVWNDQSEILRVLEIIQLLLNSGANVNAGKEFGYTPLHLACTKSRLNIVKLLLKSGADISQKSENEETAKDLAKFNGHLHIVQYLDNLEKQLVLLQDHFNSGIWINDPDLFKLLPTCFQSQVCILVYLLNSDGLTNEFPIELFHELLIELWSQYHC